MKIIDYNHRSVTWMERGKLIHIENLWPGRRFPVLSIYLSAGILGIELLTIYLHRYVITLWLLNFFLHIVGSKHEGAEVGRGSAWKDFWDPHDSLFEWVKIAVHLGTTVLFEFDLMSSSVYLAVLNFSIEYIWR